MVPGPGVVIVQGAWQQNFLQLLLQLLFFSADAYKMLQQLAIAMLCYLLLNCINALLFCAIASLMLFLPCGSWPSSSAPRLYALQLLAAGTLVIASCITASSGGVRLL